MTDWVLLAFLIFIGMCSLAIGWLIMAAQRMLDRQFEQDDRAMRKAMKRWPP